MTEDALLAEIIEHSDDDGPRLVYADKLVEAGDPRGEFIQIQCAIAAGNRDVSLLRREQALLARYGARWIKELKPGVVSGTFCRGFLQDLHVKPRKFFRHANSILTRTPVTGLCVFGLAQKRVASLVDLPQLSSLRRLMVAECRIGANGLSTMLASPVLAGVTDLSLRDINLDTLEPLHHWHKLTGLKRLSIAQNPLPTPTLLFLARGGRAISLDHLDMGNSAYIGDLLQIVYGLPSLSSVTFGANHPAGSTMSRLVTSPLGNVRHLHLTFPGCQGQFVGMMGWAPWDLHSLVMPLNQRTVSVEDAQRLAQGDWKEFTKLHLDYAGLNGDSIAALTESNWPLADLHLWANQVEADGVRAIGGRWSKSLETLNLSFNPIKDAGVKAMADFDWPRLHALKLRNSGLTNGGIDHLVWAVKRMPALVVLDISHNQVDRGPTKPLLDILGPGLKR